MPLYEYQCRSCGAVTDVRHGFDEKNTKACPTCGGELAKRFSPTGIVFKGSGFYVNDSRASSGGASPSTKSPASEKPASSDAPVAQKSEKSESSGASEKKSDAPAPPKGDTAAA